MKNILIILIGILSFACSGQKEKQSIVEQPNESNDSAQLSVLLELENHSNQQAIEESEIEKRNRTISFNSLKPTPCNLQVILYAYENVEDLSKDAIDIFLRVFSNQCDDHIEFSEFSKK